MEMLKRCNLCGESKPLSAYRKQTTTRDGLHPYCRECFNRENMAYHFAKHDPERRGTRDSIIYRRKLAKILTRYEVLPNGCWQWLGAKRNGYGRFKLDGRYNSAHRFFYERKFGKILPGLELDHLCRNRACINPAHLQPVTSQINSHRGEGPTAENARKTHCSRGHEYTPENTLSWNKGKSRWCRQCNELRHRRQAKPAAE